MRCLGRIEDLGYTDVFTQETDGADAFTPLGVAAATAPSLRLGTAIANVYSRGPALLAMQAATLAEAAPGRFVLGLGTSSTNIVEGWNGLPLRRPLTRMRDTLAFLRTALAGERCDAAYRDFAVRGFRLAAPPATLPPLFVAGLGPGMRRLAAEEADGLLLSLVGPEDVGVLAREAKDIAAARSLRAGFEVGMRIGVIVGDDPAAARAHCKRLIAAYLSVAAYRGLHERLGRADELAPVWAAWERGDRRSAVEAVPDALVDALFLHGCADACREGLERFVDAGLDTPIVSLMRWDGPLVEVLEALSPRGA